MAFKSKFGAISEMAYDGATFDFVGGARVEVPDSCRCRHFKLINLDTAQVLKEFIASPENEDERVKEMRNKIKSGMTLVPVGREGENLTPESSLVFFSNEKNEYVNWRIEQYDENDDLVFSCNMDLTDREVWVEICSFSLGDCIAWFKCAEDFRIKHKCRMNVIISRVVIDIFKGKYPNVSFHEREARTIIPDSAYAMYFIGAVNGSSVEDYAYRSFFDQYVPLISIGYNTLGLITDFAPPLIDVDDERLIDERYVCISTLSSIPNKNWERENGWNELCIALKSEGYRVLDIDRYDHVTYERHGKILKIEHIPEEAEDWTGDLPIRDRLQLLRHSECLIGLSSGAALMSWLTHTPRVLVIGSTIEHVEFLDDRYIPVQNFQACRGCLTREPFESLCDVCKHLGTEREFECTRHTTPEMVLSAFHKIIN